MVNDTAFRSATDVFDWLARFVNLEQGVMPPSMRPERMRIIADVAGNPEQAAPSIHIAGSKGKGSITAMTSAILEEAGFRVGRYMSPHVVDYRERITLGNHYFDERIYVAAGERLRNIAALLSDTARKPYQALLSVSDGASAEPTFFELLTLYFFLCAQEAGCNALVVETGMGGRLDPTNISKSACVVITCIELEHTDMLGETIQQIAREKAGIIKPKTPAFIANQTHANGAEALAVFRAAAFTAQAPLIYLPEFISIENIDVLPKGTSWNMRFLKKAPDCVVWPAREDDSLTLCVPVPGAIQAENASLAVCAALTAFPGLSADAIQRGLARVQLPARFETLRTAPPVVVDGAHTAISVRLCAETWAKLYGRDGCLIFGCASGKDAGAMARALLPCFRHITITRPGTYKPSEPEKVFAAWKEAAQELPQAAQPTIELIPDTETAIKSAFGAACCRGKPLLGTGSFYMAAEIRHIVPPLIGLV